MKIFERRASLRWGVLAVGLLIIAGCASAPPVPQDRYYRMQAVLAEDALIQPVLNGVLEIERFSADGLTAGRPIVYVKPDDPHQLLEYHYHFWIQPPTVMLRDELVTYLRGAKVAPSIVTPEMRVDPDFVLTGRIRTLEQILGTPNSTELELEIAIRQESDGKLLFLKTYRNEAETSSAGVASAVDALNEALNIVYSDFLADLRGL